MEAAGNLGGDCAWHQEAGAHPQLAGTVGSITAEGRAEGALEGAGGPLPDIPRSLEAKSDLAFESASTEG